MHHWSNEETTVDYLEKSPFPYISRKRQELKLALDYPVFVIFDSFEANVQKKVFILLETHHLLTAVVPANCTDKLQPLDVSANKAAKEFLRRQFHEWYSEQISSQLWRDERTTIQPIDLLMGVVKPIGAKWMVLLFEYLVKVTINCKWTPTCRGLC